jgi:hypothetical protein
MYEYPSYRQLPRFDRVCMFTPTMPLAQPPPHSLESTYSESRPLRPIKPHPTYSLPPLSTTSQERLNNMHPTPSVALHSPYPETSSRVTSRATFISQRKQADFNLLPSPPFLEHYPGSRAPTGIPLMPRPKRPPPPSPGSSAICTSNYRTRDKSKQACESCRKRKTKVNRHG